MEQVTINKVQIVFFSGTGGTKRIAQAFENEVKRRNKAVDSFNLEPRINENSIETNCVGNSDLYILLYPVYALDAPRIVHNWIEGLGSDVIGKRIAVISVSGGGEVWPNTGCRQNCCTKLEQKGMKVVYDNMMCMPANMLAEPNDHLVMHLVNIIPEKVNKALDDIFNNKISRTAFKKSKLRNIVTNLENKNSHKFIDGLMIDDQCKGCGWCAQNCPMSNIKISEETSKPVFSDKCTACLRCIYGCPFHAIQAKSSLIFKKGFDIDAVEKRMSGVPLAPIKECCKGIMFKGVYNYLLNKY